jgi:hypothetical protein
VIANEKRIEPELVGEDAGAQDVLGRLKIIRKGKNLQAEPESILTRSHPIVHVVSTSTDSRNNVR